MRLSGGLSLADGSTAATPLFSSQREENANESRTRTKSPESASAESGLFCLYEVVCWLLFSRKDLFLHLLAKTVQHSIIGKVNHVIQLVLWKIIQIDGIPVRLLNRRAVIATNNLARVNHPIEIAYISGAFQRDFIVMFIGIKLRKNLIVQFVADWNITKRLRFICSVFSQTIFLYMLIDLTQQTTISCNRPLYGTTTVR